MQSSHRRLTLQRASERISFGDRRFSVTGCPIVRPPHEKNGLVRASIGIKGQPIDWCRESCCVAASGLTSDAISLKHIARTHSNP